MKATSPSLVRERLLEDWQRSFPLCGRPFAVIANSLGVCEAEVIQCLTELEAEGLVSRVGGVVRPNTLGASTLAAIAAPEYETNAVATMLAAEPGVNHVYLRENDWNLWFVVTGPDRAYVDQTLERIHRCTGLRVLDLRLELPFHIDLGFSLTGRNGQWNSCGEKARPIAWQPWPGDKELVQTLTEGLPLVSRPFREIAARLGRSESEIIERLESLACAGILPRIGVIVRHRALGWRSNAMVVWDVPPDNVELAGLALASAPGVTLCYRRTRYEDDWPYNLYCMVHARSRTEAMSCVDSAEKAAELEGCPRQVLFSLRCFKQTGAMLALPKEAA